MEQTKYKLADLLIATRNQRRQDEHNRREAERLDAYQEFADDGDSRELIGEEMAERLLPKQSAWDIDFNARLAAAQAAKRS